MPELTRKEREKKRKRDEILEASLSVFAQKGYHGATMAEISQASEYPLGTIYKFFQGKEQIYYVMVRDIGIALGDILLEVFSQEDWSPSKKIKEYLKRFISYGIEKSNSFLLYNSQRSSIDAVLFPNINETINKLHNKMRHLLTDIFKEGIEKGEFMDYPPEEMSNMYSSITFSTIWNLTSGEEISEEELEAKIDNIFNIFTKGVIQEKS